MATPVRARPSRQVLADHVYDEVMTSLIDGKLRPDEPLNIDSLSRDLEVSPTPVREALARLESTGLVVRAALKGYRVAPLFRADEVVELMDARALIEPENAFRAGSRITASALALLNESIDQSTAAARLVEVGAIRSYWKADEEFHRLIADAAENRFLVAAYSALGGHVQRFRLFGGHGVSDAADAISEHRRILDALVSQDADAARQAMALHIANVRDRAVADANHID